MTTKVSIITVVYNSVNLIENTILSVIGQTYKNIEYIIIDGGSTDGTLEVINKYNNKITKWVSEPDHGIYDAMNKGILMASGDWIIFMNSGDKFYNEDVLSDIFKIQFPDYIKVIYGSTLMHYIFGDYIVRPDNIQKLTSCMPVCHQSVLCRLEIARTYKFNCKIKITADHDMLLRVYNNYPNSFIEYNGIISDYDASEGVSAKQTLQGYNEAVDFTAHKDSIFRKIRIWMRAYLPNCILIPLFRMFFLFKKRYKRI